MNKKLGLLLLTGLAAVFCASCSKVEELFPESFSHNGKPFSVDKVPVEGGSITLDRGRVTDSVYSIIRLNPSDTVSSFKAGDTIILTATPTNGYTFINWVRNGVGTSTDPIYKFCLEEKDLDNGRVKYHYEARFGNDYAIQSIPSIDEVMPADLIAAMGPYLHFGDNPPRIDVCFSLPDSIMLHTLIKSNPNGAYNFDNEETWPKECLCNFNAFMFENLHRCIAESHYFERQYYNGEIIYYATAVDSIFIMGHDDYFTAYFHQTWKPFSNYSNILLLTINSRRESVILSGKMGDEGVEEFQWGVRIESYDPANSSLIDAAPGNGGQPGIHDIMIFNSNRTLLYDPTFQKTF